MTRDVRGRPVAPDKDEKVTGQRAPESEGGEYAKHLAVCEDCMKTVAAHAGLSKKEDGYKAEDQGGKAKIEVGEKRKRH